MLGQPRRRWAPKVGLLAVLAVAEFMLTLDLSIVNVGLPAIRDDLGFTRTSLPWVINAYALAFGGFLLLGGRAADLVGGRTVFLGALSGFTLASLACGLAQDPGPIVVARAVQGLSAGVLSPATLSILTATYDEPSERNRALSIWTAVAIGGGAIGGLVGGVITDVLSWRWIFLVNVPVGALLFVLALTRLPRSHTAAGLRHLDVGGAITATAGLTAVVWALMRTDATGWGSGDVIGGFVAAAALLTTFVVIETRMARAPLVPFAVFRSRLLWAGNLMSFLSFVPVMATWYFLSLYLQGVRGYTPTEAGTIFLPISIAVIAGSQISFRILPRTDARILFGLGGLTAAAGMAWLGRLASGTDIAGVMAPACLAMIGGGLMFAPITVAATAGASPDQGGLASGLLNTTRQVGGALGLAILGTIAAASATTREGLSQPSALTDGYATAFTVGATIFLATAIAGVLALPSGLDATPTTPEPTTTRAEAR
jgi:EmrB/QacA subfamily drug resistance transporter